MTIAPESIKELDFPTPDPVMIAAQELAAIMVTREPDPAPDVWVLDTQQVSPSVELWVPAGTSMLDVQLLMEPYRARGTQVVVRYEEPYPFTSLGHPGFDYDCCSPSRGQLWSGFDPTGWSSEPQSGRVENAIFSTTIAWLICAFPFVIITGLLYLLFS